MSNLTPGHVALIKLLAAQAARAYLTEQTRQPPRPAANDSNRAIPQAANSR